MKSCVVWLLILLTIHAPVPCPDLDGECRGAPIESLAEMQAWHVLMLGIRPNDDIDRGPIRPSDQGNPTTPDETPLGKLAVVSIAASHSTSAIAHWDGPIYSNRLPLLAVESCLNGVAPVWWRPPIATSSSRRLARLCVWRV